MSNNPGEAGRSFLFAPAKFRSRFLLNSQAQPKARSVAQIARRAFGASGVAFLGQGVVTLSNLALGVVLAQSLRLQERGAVSIANVVTSFMATIGAVGIPEVFLTRQGNLRLSQAARVLVLIVCVAVAAATGAMVLLFGGNLGRVDHVLLAIVVSLSALNAMQIARLLLVRGVGYVATVQGVYAVSLVLLTLLAALILGGLDFTSTFVAYAVAEILICLLCAYLVRCVDGNSKVPEASIEVEVLKIKGVFRYGAAHAVSQVGPLFADRGLIIFAAALGSLSATALITVALSAASLVLIPVTALARLIVVESASQDASFGKRYHSALVGAGVSLVLCVVLTPVMPRLISTVFGSEYSTLGNGAMLLPLVGLLLAMWRTGHLIARGRRKPSIAVASDAVALSAALTVAVIVVLDGSPSGVLTLMLTYAGAGCSTVLLLLLFRRKAYSPTTKLMER